VNCGALWIANGQWNEEHPDNPVLAERLSAPASSPVDQPRFKALGVIASPPILKNPDKTTLEDYAGSGASCEWWRSG
jgi:hypothetical protein